MKCPVCEQNTPDSWRPWLVTAAGGGTRNDLRVEPPIGAKSTVSLDYMYCANDECRQLVIRVHENVHLPLRAVEDPEMLTRTWFARPRTTTRSVDPLVPEPYRTDYLEAAAILDLSPRMSAVMSRRILADLLAKYANHDECGLKDRIDKFAADKTHPSQ